MLCGVEFDRELQDENKDQPRLLFINGTDGDLHQKLNVIEGALSKNLQILAHDQRGLDQTCKLDHTVTMAG